MPDVGNENPEYFKLRLGKLGVISVHKCFLSVHVERERLVRKSCRIGRCGAHSAEHGIDPGYYFPYGERFGDIVVSAEVEALQRVFFGIFGRNEYDGDFRAFRILFHHLSHLETGNAFHHHIQEHQVIADDASHQCVFCRQCRGCFISGLVEIEFQDVAYIRFIIDYKNFFYSVHNGSVFAKLVFT